ncbi:LLM class F420-dependent oxidoreductase [Pseudomonadales bacterium]|nr:LLM class F420-dependent oxidoreductase [Pseudomonadales bacterium]MDB0050121.1 LLM class F420-dependent oxidoreductase [Pseudomonadales bacterium]MDB2596601.1 LLM class F420-dependent oxidoreductase [Pseudomonadales bacterium]
MKLSVEFPSVAYREGPAAVKKLAKAIEDIGFDQLDMFDHVLMGYGTDQRPAPMYPPKMPIMEALMVLSYAAAVTDRIGLGTEVLILPQRQPTLVAKQISTLDTLSGGRVRLGVGVGWQASEYEALNEDFGNRGKRMDESIKLIRAYWTDEEVNFQGEFYTANAMAMEPKSPQGSKLPIWIGGTSKAALRRVAELGDGWLATAIEDVDVAKSFIQRIHEHAESIGRNPNEIGMQMMLDVPPRDEAGKQFYKHADNVLARADAVKSAGFEWGALNATAMFQAGYKSVDALIDQLAVLHDALRAHLGK